MILSKWQFQSKWFENINQNINTICQQVYIECCGKYSYFQCLSFESIEKWSQWKQRIIRKRDLIPVKCGSKIEAGEKFTQYLI